MLASISLRMDDQKHEGATDRSDGAALELASAFHEEMRTTFHSLTACPSHKAFKLQGCGLAFRFPLSMRLSATDPCNVAQYKPWALKNGLNLRGS